MQERGGTVGGGCTDGERTTNNKAKRKIEIEREGRTDGRMERRGERELLCKDGNKERGGEKGRVKKDV